MTPPPPIIRPQPPLKQTHESWFCRNYGHIFVRSSFFGVEFGKPYCLRCGRDAA